MLLMGNVNHSCYKGVIMQVEKIESYPPNCNPYEHDPTSIGTQVGVNVTILCNTHWDQKCNEFVIVNIETGERLKIEI